MEESVKKGEQKKKSGYEAYIESLAKDADEMSSKVDSSERMTPEEAQKEDKAVDGIEGSRV